jgi:SAM-dependent methyltransferase
MPNVTCNICGGEVGFFSPEIPLHGHRRFYCLNKECENHGGLNKKGTVTLIEIFNIGMYRNYAPVLQNKTGLVLNLGAGEKHITGSIPLDYPEWNAEISPIPYDDNSVDMIHAYHFLEHIANTSFIMSEIQRVLKPRGHVNIVVPYYNSSLMAQDPDHKRAFNERTWKNLFSTECYSKDKVVPMEICTNFIMGDEERNLILLTQLRKIS